MSKPTLPLRDKIRLHVPSLAITFPPDDLHWPWEGPYARGKPCLKHNGHKAHPVRHLANEEVFPSLDEQPTRYSHTIRNSCGFDDCANPLHYIITGHRQFARHPQFPGRVLALYEDQTPAKHTNIPWSWQNWDEVEFNDLLETLPTLHNWSTSHPRTCSKRSAPSGGRSR